MERDNKPRQREKNVTGEGKGVSKKGSGLGTGPVGKGTSPGGRKTTSSSKGASSSGSSFGSGPRGGSQGPKRTQRSGGLNPLTLIILVVVFLLFGGKGLFQQSDSPTTGGSQNAGNSAVQTTGSSATSTTGQSQTTSGGSQSAPSANTSSSSHTSSNTGAVTTSSAAGKTGVLNTNVSSLARSRYTSILGNGRDTITLMVYMCGTDLESRASMGTSDLSEMTKATLGSNINLLVYTGGCSRWQNKVVSSKYNQIYRIVDGGLQCLKENAGTGSMTNPATLTDFITWSAQNYPANRYQLILWDHGGGSLSGYGYDEKNKSSGSMSLASLNTALKNAGLKYDFIGFDACLMATVENALMLADYADYLIASEETEPGIGWYYTNWLTSLSKNPSMSTLEVGKNIVDDFVATCKRQCRGQSATLSVVDLAELSQTMPSYLTDFSQDLLNKIENQQYQSISNARCYSREFATSSKIDQIDFVDFAKRVGTTEGDNLSKVMMEAVKYNLVSSGMSGSYGLSIYFPYKKLSNVNTAISTYNALGMDTDYADCIRAFASLELGGQMGSGTTGSPWEVLLGGGYGGSSQTSSSQTSSSGYGMDASDLVDVLSLLLGGTSQSQSLSGQGAASVGSSYGSMTMADSLLSGLGALAGLDTSFFGGRSLTPESVVDYVTTNRFDPTCLNWQTNDQGDRVISMDDTQWDYITAVDRNLFVDDGEGFIDLGLDNTYSFDEDGNLVADMDKSWISLDNQPVAYYHLQTLESEEDDSYAIIGYVPALLNGDRVNLYLVFDSETPTGYVAGAQLVYGQEETDTIPRGLIDLTAGDKLTFLCDYYTYSGDYQDSYQLGDVLTVTDSLTISDTTFNSQDVTLCYRFTDLYQQHYWTESLVL